RMSGDHVQPGPRIALIQGDISPMRRMTDQQARKILDQYSRLSIDAMKEYPDLIVWPETMYPNSLTFWETAKGKPMSALGDPKKFNAADDLRVMAKYLGSPMIIGAGTQVKTPDSRRGYNSAVLVDPSEGIVGRYDKVHRVMFGEYVPLAEYFPWISRRLPVSGIVSGDPNQEPLRFKGYSGAVNICFESTVPHLIRGQAQRLHDSGEKLDVLINLSNDGWFDGSSALDMHLACGVFRAIECRKPMVIAANTGFSAWIDADGRVRWQGKRNAQDYFVAPVELDSRESPYVRWGDWPAAMCNAACWFLALAIGFDWLRRRASRESTPTDDPSMDGQLKKNDQPTDETPTGDQPTPSESS
ncbi:MAG: apolipoprotein N-acyltransferase, partial [Planctomycetales bacterium]